MESIILLILFTYPGAMVDYLHSLLVKGKRYEKKEEEYFRVARDFFLSATVTAITLIPVCHRIGIKYSLKQAKDAITTGNGLYEFLIISFILSLLIAVLWYLVFNKLVLWIKNLIREKRNHETLSEEKNIWDSLFKDPKIDYANSAFAIYKGNEMVRAGIPHIVTENVENDPWIVLKYNYLVEDQLSRKPKDRIIEGPFISYINMGNGYTIDLYHAKKLIEYIKEQIVSTSSPSPSSEAQQS